MQIPKFIIFVLKQIRTMKYIIRAVKYFIYICVLITLILCILVLCKMVSPDIDVMFRNGWRSVGLIAAVFAAMSAIYPLFGYSRRLCAVLGDYADLHDGVIACMEERGYKLESETDETMTFRSKSAAHRILRVWEDRITLEKSLGGFQVEGLSRDITRVIYALEYRFRPNGPAQD